MRLFLLLLFFVATVHAQTAYPQTGNFSHITYGPGVCGATLNCNYTASGILLGPVGICGVDYVCNGTDPWATCNAARTGCTCVDKCAYGPLCQLRIDGTTPPRIDCRTITPEAAAIRNALYPNNRVTATPLPCNGRCNATECVHQDTVYGYNIHNGVVIYDSDICCERGWTGNVCEVPVGCSKRGCDHGGQCLRTTSTGVTVAANDTRCFGCPPGSNTTGPGWGGAFCHIRNTPTYVFRNQTTVVGRRLLAENVLYRASDARNTAASGAIFQEPSRTCDCAVRWSSGVVDVARTTPVFLMGNTPANLTTGNGTLLSAVRFDPSVASIVLPYWHRRIRSIEEAKWQCSRDWGSAGFYLFSATADATYIGSMACTADPAALAFRAAATISPANSPGLFPQGGTVTRYDLTHIEDTGRCPDATLDRDYYCSAYPSQCAAVIERGGVGNKRIPVGLSTLEATRMAAVLHFNLFGHLVRNSPNAACDLTSNWAEDETGCLNLLRAPVSLFPLAVGAPLQCGNVSRIAPTRVAFGLPLVPEATGVNVTDSNRQVCQCNPPFASTNSERTDCAYDLCGTVEGRGLVNATFRGTFNHSAAEACVCTGVWGTDASTCSANLCSWCGATICQNLGTVNGSDYTAACQCPPIFAGPLCATSLCNITNTHPFNDTLWQYKARSDITCDCLPGYTGTYCDDLQCVFGDYSFQDRTCTCRDGYYGPQCQYERCVSGQGLFLPGVDGTADVCECYAPWTGESCAEHTCDTDNVVLIDQAGWNGVRPFGVPVPSTRGGPSLWECSCTFPYVPSALSLEGRPLNCNRHACGTHGHPNANATAVVVATDACTCSDPYGKGIMTDPRQCTNFTYDACRNPCMVGTCGLSDAAIAVLGQYIPIAENDASCCQCPATAAYLITGECQPFCAIVQPCISSSTSSFVYLPEGTAYNISESMGANVSRVPVGGEWKCGCNAGWSDSYDPIEAILKPCSIFTPIVRDVSQNTTGNDYGLEEGVGSGIAPPVDSSSEPPLNKEETTAVAIAAAVMGVLLVVACVTSGTASTAAPGAATKSITTSVVTTTTTTGTGGHKMKRPKAGYSRLIAPALYLVACMSAVHAATLTIAQARSWGDTEAMGGTTVYRIPVQFPAGVEGYIHPGSSYTYGTCRNLPWLSNPNTRIYVTARGSKNLVVLDNSYGETVWVEYAHRFNGPTNLIKVGSAFVLSSDASWSLVKYAENEDAYGIALNLCDAVRTCGAHGGCVSRALFIQSDQFTGSSGFVSQGAEREGDVNGFRPGYERVCPFGAFDFGPHYILQKHYEVRGCQCDDGWTGLRCSDECPTDRREMCSGHGFCPGAAPGTTNTLTMATCVCAGGCTCERGWTGLHCEIATQIKGSFLEVRPNEPPITDFSRCCPLNIPDCSPMQVDPLLRSYPALIQGRTGTTPKEACQGGVPTSDPKWVNCASRESSTVEYPFFRLLTERLPAPRVCGEDDTEPYAGWTPERLVPPEGNGIRGHGRCWRGIDTLQLATKAYCICSNPAYLNPVDGTLMNQKRRGWFGPACQHRTCTVRTAALSTAVRVPSANGASPVMLDMVVNRPTRARFGVVSVGPPYVAEFTNHAAFLALGPSFVYDENTFIALYGDPAGGLVKQLELVYADGTTVRYSNGASVAFRAGLQCSNHSAGQFTGKGANYDDDTGPCNDKPFVDAAGYLTNVNSPGVCRECDQGWGAYAGLHARELTGTGYNPLEYGLCSLQTFHTNDGMACGGYGGVTSVPVNIVRTSTAYTSKVVTKVSSCDCRSEWGLQFYKDSGLCLRSCAPVDLISQLAANLTDEHGTYTGVVSGLRIELRTILEAGCGGLDKGLCRPITSGGRSSGLNSACMCKAGYGGPTCTKIESMWYKGVVCGPDGEAPLTTYNVTTSPFSAKGYDDEIWFNKYIAPLDKANITDPANARLYSSYQCRCKPSAIRDGYVTDENGICAMTCASSKLMGGPDNTTLCSARGTCESDTRVGGVGKICRCELGWGGDNCGTRIFVDRLGAVCGGAERGVLAYSPGSANFSQECVCNTGWTKNATATGTYAGLCWNDCPVSPRTKVKCTSPNQGTCSTSLVTGNDNVCTCNAGGFTGELCDTRLVAAYTTASGTLIPCSGHGFGDPSNNGACVCDLGWVGSACEVYQSNRQCGTGQSFMDAEAVGIVVG